MENKKIKIAICALCVAIIGFFVNQLGLVWGGRLFGLSIAILLVLIVFHIKTR